MTKFDPDKVRWIWFDLDDTLIDFKASSHKAQRLLYDEQRGFDGAYSDFESWLQAYESHNVRLWQQYAAGEISQDFLRLDRFLTPLLPKWRGSREELERLCRRLDTRYLDLLTLNAVLMDGATDILALARVRGYNIGVLTNGFSHWQHEKLRLTGLRQLVDCVVVSDDIGVNKPAPEIFSHAMSIVGEPRPQAHLMIGDNIEADIKGGVGAGWRRIFFAHRKPSQSVPDAYAPCPKILHLDGLRELL